MHFAARASVSAKVKSEWTVQLSNRQCACVNERLDIEYLYTSDLNLFSFFPKKSSVYYRLQAKTSDFFFFFTNAPHLFQFGGKPTFLI